MCRPIAGRFYFPTAVRAEQMQYMFAFFLLLEVPLPCCLDQQHIREILAGKSMVIEIVRDFSGMKQKETVVYLCAFCLQRRP